MTKPSGCTHSPYVLLVLLDDDTNLEGRTMSGINTSASPDPSAGPEGCTWVWTNICVDQDLNSFIISFSIQT